MKTHEECKHSDYYQRIKESTIQTINDYVEHGMEPGGFVKAVLANDLMESIGRADDENLHSLFQICSYIYNEIPSVCHGSYEIVNEWMKQKRK